MDVKREVTEQDFRMPEFRDAKVEDYEFRDGDQKLVRKDRWERGIRSLAAALGKRDFEIDGVIEQVVDRLNRAMAQEDAWENEDYPATGGLHCTIKLECGSTLCGATWQGHAPSTWKWGDFTIDKSSVKQWKLE